MSIVSAVVSASLILFMFFELSTMRRMDPFQYGLTYFVLLLLCVFVPLSTVAGVTGFYLVIALLFRFVFSETNFVSACNTFIIFAVHYVSSMISSALVIMMLRKNVDFRMVFRTDHLLFLILFLTISITLIYLVKMMLYKLNDYFEQIKDQQRRLISLNVFLIFLLLMYMRIVIVSGISIAVIQDLKLQLIMIFRLSAGVTLFFWLFYTTNRNMIYSSKYNVKSTKLLDRILNKAKLDKMKLSVIYIEIPGLERIIKAQGAKEGKKIKAAIRAVVNETVPKSYSLEIKEHSMLIVVENTDFVLVKQHCDSLEKMLYAKVIIGREGEKWFIVGATEYNPVVHDNPQTLIISAQEAAYAR